MEDVILKVDKFYFPVDFMVIDTEPVQDPKKNISVILGRPFLTTANVIIHCRSGVMELIFGNMKVQMNVFSTKKHPFSEADECYESTASMRWYTLLLPLYC